LHHLRDLILIGNVQDAPTRLLAHFLGSQFHRFGILVGDGHCGSRFNQSSGDSQSNPARSAGDNAVLAYEFEVCMCHMIEISPTLS
jgi:hypothetical protein